MCAKLIFLNNNNNNKAEYLLDDMKSYQYLSNTYVAIQGSDEVEEYNNTIKAMHIMGINQDDIVCKCSLSSYTDFDFNFILQFNFHVCATIAIVRTVSGVLQMGNLQFKQERQSDQATLPDNTG